jgi:hypothetical protein
MRSAFLYPQYGGSRFFYQITRVDQKISLHVVKFGNGRTYTDSDYIKGIRRRTIIKFPVLKQNIGDNKCKEDCEVQ